MKQTDFFPSSLFQERMIHAKCPQKNIFGGIWVVYELLFYE
ncbi:hypothetical protein RR45_GL001566 [Lactococcus chungangensis CAU 28 = DSM 22330]|uniref:Uncharacterized protein n=1 Tax=Pseudolactococcus chungangensis CAU 28 = DSM 22330 TaxID=1122154 RepID=A0ABX4I9F3_9LACT|nr:hypothetical protein RR45_GL001566 [Lactococcus chungangensis CAU 28 = DSM 22330]